MAADGARRLSAWNANDRYREDAQGRAICALADPVRAERITGPVRNVMEWLRRSPGDLRSVFCGDGSPLEECRWRIRGG